VPSLGVDSSHFFAQPDFVNAAQLVEQDPRAFSLKSHLWAASQGAAGAGQRRNDDPWQGLIQIIR
jgi:hypothetical protein